MDEEKVIYEEKPLNTRFVGIMEHFRYTKNSLAVLLGVSATTLKNIEIHKNFPAMETIYKLLELHPEINVQWLFKGQGQMFEDGTSSEERIKSLQQKIEYLEEKERQMVSTVKYWMGRASELEKENIKIQLEKQEALDEAKALKKGLG
jgi:transcriptional regulator with XRE-family HTH domain